MVDGVHEVFLCLGWRWPPGSRRLGNRAAARGLAVRRSRWCRLGLPWLGCLGPLLRMRNTTSLRCGAEGTVFLNPDRRHFSRRLTQLADRPTASAISRWVALKSFCARASASAASRTELSPASITALARVSSSAFVVRLVTVAATGVGGIAPDVFAGPTPSLPGSSSMECLFTGMSLAASPPEPPPYCSLHHEPR